jgi:hypothetical protein
LPEKDRQNLHGYMRGFGLALMPVLTLAAHVRVAGHPILQFRAQTGMSELPQTDASVTRQTRGSPIDPLQPCLSSQ